MLNNIWKETLQFRKDEQLAFERYYEAIRDINTFYEAELITEDTLRYLSEKEIIELISNAEMPDHAEKTEPVIFAGASTYLDASIDLCEKKIARLRAEDIDDSYTTRHVFVVTKSLFVAGLFALTNILSVSVISGAIAYLYFAKKDISLQKESIHSKRTSEWAMDNITSRLNTLKKLKDNL
ncbi:hypothetical protein [Lacimicrobium sp. SS2-24]|uniref:hypothetical protein n=1 Tax=Lacimicrobium sp. SS2-24 TaxID=2005569 RepID=UPI000B4ACDC2|nr:hypothetical protein [Lacimicrobium sp. SS2-24]